MQGPNLRDRSVQGLENLKIFDRTEQGLEKFEILGLTEARVYPNIDANLRILQSDIDDIRPRYGKSALYDLSRVHSTIMGRMSRE